MATHSEDGGGGGKRNARLETEIDFALGITDGAQVRAWPSDWRARGTVDYLYIASHMLVEDGDLPRAQAALRELDVSHEIGDSLIDGLTLLQVSGEVPDLCAALDARLGVGVVTPEHAFNVAGYGALCPATEPDVVLAATATPEEIAAAPWPYPPAADPSAGAGVRVSVVDTGLIDGAAAWAPWLAGVRPNSPADIEDPDVLDVGTQQFQTDGFADPYAGHGTFIAGVIRSVAPAADIVVDGVFDKGGLVAERDLLIQLHQALAAAPDLINLSGGTYTRRNVPSLGFQVLYEQRLRHLGGVLLVAAAGNDQTRDPFWPAAFPWCVGVGSMSQDGLTRSDFSNYGSWVDVYAAGEDLVNAYPQMQYKTLLGGQERDTSAGVVSWSGTSFAAPIVTGLIAARMSRTGETAQQAWVALQAAALGQFRPGVGPRLFA